MKLASKISMLSGWLINNNRFLKFWQFCQALLHKSHDDIAIRVNGYETIRKPISGLFLANTKSYHFGFTTSNDAEIDSGLIHLLLIGEMPTYLLYYYYGLCIWRNMDMNLSEVSSELVTLRRCLDIEITSEQPIKVSLDSADYMVANDFHVQIVPAAIRMLLPY
jgi:diacylglycerol kinase family enzyme